MHEAVLDYFRELTEDARLATFFEYRRVVEFGSLDINGSVRKFFRDCDYTGIDLAPGPGVDVVSAAKDWSPEPGSRPVDVVVSTEMLEHDCEWRESLANMARVLRPAGLKILTCAKTGREAHGTITAHSACSPLTVAMGGERAEYYRNLTQADIESAIDRVFEWHAFDVNGCDLRFCGITSPLPVCVAVAGPQSSY